MICNLLATTAREFGTYYRIAIVLVLTGSRPHNCHCFEQISVGFESHSRETEMLLLWDKVYLPIPPENIYVRRLTLLNTRRLVLKKTVFLRGRVR